MSRRPAGPAGMAWLALLLLPLGLAACGGTPPAIAPPAAKVIFHSGMIFTPAGPIAEGALAVGADGRILEVGEGEPVLERCQGPGTELVDLKGGFVYPGLMDSLGNLLQLGTSLQQVDLLDTPSEEEMIERVRSRARRTPKGQWILGMGWDQNHWPVPVMPDHEKLSEAVPDHPVWLLRVDALCGLANRRALDLCGIDRESPDPKGGRIVRRRDGAPSGILLRTAVDLVAGRIPTPSRVVVKARFLEAQEACFRNGLTGVFVPGLDWSEITLLQELVDSGIWYLPVAASVRCLGDPGVVTDRAPLKGYKGLLDVRCLTLYMDGAVGSRGAALLEDYADEPMNKGILTYTRDEVVDVARAALERGFQLSLHCIGDRAAREALDAFAEVSGGKPIPELRWRIEHSQVVAAEDRDRYRDLGIIPSMQPTHCTSDMDWALSRLGDWRRDRAYNWRAFADLGLRIAGGSDFPVESCDPLKGIYAAVTTMREDGTPEGGFLPEVVLTRQEALDLFTVNSAYAVFHEDERGTLEAGKLAHLTVYSQDILSVPPSRILRTKVLFTVIGGRVRYAAP